MRDAFLYPVHPESFAPDVSWRKAGVLCSVEQSAWEHFLGRLSDWMGLAHSFHVSAEGDGPLSRRLDLGLNVIAFQPIDLLKGFIQKDPKESSIEVFFLTSKKMILRISGAGGRLTDTCTVIKHLRP